MVSETLCDNPMIQTCNLSDTSADLSFIPKTLYALQTISRMRWI